MDYISANVEQPSPEAVVRRNVTAADVVEPEAADGNVYEKLQLEQISSLRHVAALEAFVKEMDNNNGGFGQEYRVSSCS